MHARQGVPGLEEKAEPKLLVDLTNDRITALIPAGECWTRQQLLQIQR
ncbi:hypothetical protein [Streptomyces sp. TLI_053]|nr:hypothetical protein [Streptomyces sp. TLI_053]